MRSEEVKLPNGGEFDGDFHPMVGSPESGEKNHQLNKIQGF